MNDPTRMKSVKYLKIEKALHFLHGNISSVQFDKTVYRDNRYLRLVSVLFISQLITKIINQI